MASYTLFDCVYQTMREMGILTEGVATGGTTSTLIDTVDRTEPDDAWNGGTVLITYDAGGAGAAPQGQYSYVSDFSSTTATATVRTAFTVAPAAGDRYAIAKKKYPLQYVIQNVNKALKMLGVVPYTDSTTITTADNQTEYNLPQSPLELREVWLQTNDDDSDDNRWVPLTDCRIGLTATGTANLLIFPVQPASGYAVKLVYGAVHPDLAVYTDKLSDEVPIQRVIYAAAREALLDKMKEIDPIIMTKANNLDDKDARAVALHPIRELPHRKGRIIKAYGRTNLYEPAVGTVNLS